MIKVMKNKRKMEKLLQKGNRGDTMQCGTWIGPQNRKRTLTEELVEST